jgi:hypothetical protein
METKPVPYGKVKGNCGIAQSQYQDEQQNKQKTFAEAFLPQPIAMHKTIKKKKIQSGREHSGHIEFLASPRPSPFMR